MSLFTGFAVNEKKIGMKRKQFCEFAKKICGRLY